MADEWREHLESLRTSFEAIAVSSLGVFHTMVERQQLQADTSADDHEPPRWKSYADQHPNAVQMMGGLPGDPPWFRELSAEEVAAVPPASDDDNFIRDQRGVAHAQRQPAVLRDGYLTGHPDSVPRFRQLAEAAGRVFRGIPSDALSALPRDLAEIPTKGLTIDRRYVFGDVGGARPRWMARGWLAGIARFEKGVIVDVPEAGTGSRNGSAVWLLLLHRIGWMGATNALLKASRYFWRRNSMVEWHLAQHMLREGPATTDDPLDTRMEGTPIHRFFSELGETDGAPTDVCWASTWALDFLLKAMTPAVCVSAQIRNQLQLVQRATRKDAQGQSPRDVDEHAIQFRRRLSRPRQQCPNENGGDRPDPRQQVVRVSLD